MKAIDADTGKELYKFKTPSGIILEKHENVYWFSEGADGWQFDGFPLVVGTPIPMEK